MEPEVGLSPFLTVLKNSNLVNLNLLNAILLSPRLKKIFAWYRTSEQLQRP